MSRHKLGRSTGKTHQSFTFHDVGTIKRASQAAWLRRAKTCVVVAALLSYSVVMFSANAAKSEPQTAKLTTE